mmetsp:Transcript_14957/g.15477  ORF Transcript_14957/g.15477 Transcript_14957/m.15477 type:complete len:91 (-) Transcript_14957:546-818(-)
MHSHYMSLFYLGASVIIPFSLNWSSAFFPRNINIKINPNRTMARKGLAHIQAQAIRKINETQAKKKATKIRIVAPIAPRKGIIPTNIMKG